MASNLTLKRKRRSPKEYRAMERAIAAAPKDFNIATADEQRHYVRAKVLGGNPDFTAHNFKKNVDLSRENLSKASFRNASMPGTRLGTANEANLDGVTWTHGSAVSLTNSRINNAIVYALQAPNLAARNLSMDGTISAANNFSGIQGQGMTRRGGFAFNDSYDKGDLTDSRHSAFTVGNSYAGAHAPGATFEGYMAYSDLSTMNLTGGSIRTRGNDNTYNATILDDATVGEDVAIEAVKTEAHLDQAKILHAGVAHQATQNMLHRKMPGAYHTMKLQAPNDNAAMAPVPAPRAMRLATPAFG